jgi:hypothetical protein
VRVLASFFGNAVILRKIRAATVRERFPRAFDHANRSLAVAALNAKETAAPRDIEEGAGVAGNVSGRCSAVIIPGVARVDTLHSFKKRDSAMPIARSRQQVDLSGDWEFCIDPDDVGLAQNWQVAGRFDRQIAVPGAWNAQGVTCDNAQLLRECEERNLQGVVPELRGPGNESSRMYSPFPGPAWYRRKVAVPKRWGGEQIWLVFEGVHRYAELWVDGVHLGRHLSYLTPFSFQHKPPAQARCRGGGGGARGCPAEPGD